MNILSPIGNYLSRSVVANNSSKEDGSVKTSFVNNRILTNGVLILGASFLALKKRRIPKDTFIKEGIETSNKNHFIQLIEKSKNLLSHKSASKYNKPIQVELPNVKKEMFDPRIPGSKLSDEERLSRIFVRLKDIWSKDGKVLPEKIDEILTNHVGERRVRELPFYVDEKKGILYGRKKSYKMRSGNIFVLEAHNGKDGGIETRCYLAIDKNRNQLERFNRLYLAPDGIFEPDQYFLKKAHLTSSDSAIEWINKII